VCFGGRGDEKGEEKREEKKRTNKTAEATENVAGREATTGQEGG
jgi:hypothetical protein